MEKKQLQMTRSAVKSIQHYINDIQLFVLQPSNKVARKSAALHATLRIERLAKSLAEMCDRELGGPEVITPTDQEAA